MQLDNIRDCCWFHLFFLHFTMFYWFVTYINLRLRFYINILVVFFMVHHPKLFLISFNSFCILFARYLNVCAKEINFTSSRAAVSVQRKIDRHRNIINNLFIWHIKIIAIQIMHNFSVLGSAQKEWKTHLRVLVDDKTRSQFAAKNGKIRSDKICCVELWVLTLAAHSTSSKMDENMR